MLFHPRLRWPAVPAVLAPALPQSVERYPEIAVEVLIEPAFTGIVAQRVDTGIRPGESFEKDVVAVPATGRFLAWPSSLQRPTSRGARRHRPRLRERAAATWQNLPEAGLVAAAEATGHQRCGSFRWRQM